MPASGLGTLPPMSDPSDAPPARYDARLAGELEARWQAWWDEDGTWEVPNPSGALSAGWDQVADRPKAYVLDMFPYPSGAGLHVGHPLGYIGTDVYGRFLRMTGHNVVHTIGYDAFGLPAEQYAVETGQHPRVTTEANIATMRHQLKRLGLAHDHRRAVATTDVAFVRWTQWIFLQIYNSWFDEEQQLARPISELEEQLAREPDWADLTRTERRRLVDERRLAYRANAMVNWCPGLGTVLANEEVTADGRSDRGNFPVFRRPLTQWMLRITAYADRLLADLDGLDWPEPVRLMQRNWIGRSTGATVRFPSPAGPIEVFTTRPDTLFGATFMVLAPEHPLVERLVAGMGKDVDVAFCPERIAEGKAMTELFELPQLVAARTDRAMERSAKLFRTLTAQVVPLAPEEAELAKLFTNTWRYIRFAIANQLYMIANDYGLDFERIRGAMAHDYPRAADLPGAGFAAGPCLLKDTMQLAAFNNNNFTLGHAAMMVNEGLPLYVVHRLEQRFDLPAMTVGILGMGFKAESDDARDSLSYKLKRILRFKAAGVLTTDPHVRSDPDLLALDEVLERADVLVIGAPHQAYAGLKPRQPVIDIWDLYGNGVVV